jgi:hypothetical protein
MATTTMSVGESSLLSQYLDFCKTLASMGQTISFSLTLVKTFYFSLGANLLHMNPLSIYVPCNSQIISIVKKNTHRSSIESPNVPLQETSIGSGQHEAPYRHVLSKDRFHA